MGLSEAYLLINISSGMYSNFFIDAKCFVVMPDLKLYLQKHAHVQSTRKKYVYFAKQDPGRARQNR